MSGESMQRILYVCPQCGGVMHKQCSHCPRCSVRVDAIDITTYSDFLPSFEWAKNTDDSLHICPMCKDEVIGSQYRNCEKCQRAIAECEARERASRRRLKRHLRELLSVVLSGAVAAVCFAVVWKLSH